MRKILKHEFDAKSVVLSCIIIAAVLLFIALSLDGLGGYSHFTDNIDYIFPILILFIIYNNFKYLKDKDDCIAYSTIPKTKYEIFKLRYIVSLIQIGVIIISFFFISLIFQGMLTIYYYPSYFIEEIHFGFFFLSIFTKIFFLILLFNIFLFLFLKGKKVSDGMSHIAIVTIIMTFIFGTLTYFFSVETNFSFFSIVAPFSTLNSVSNAYAMLIFGKHKELSYIAILQLVAIVVLSITLTILQINKIKKLDLEDYDKENNSKIFKVTLLAISIISILATAIILDNFSVGLSILIIFNFALYSMYSLYVNRFKPNRDELLLYFILFSIGIFLPYFI